MNTLCVIKIAYTCVQALFTFSVTNFFKVSTGFQVDLSFYSTILILIIG